MSLDAIGIICEDLVKSANFYKVLGIDVKETGGPEHLEGSTDCGMRIMLDSIKLVKELNPDWVKPTSSGIVLCFDQGTSAMVDQKYNQILKLGFKSITKPWDAFWGQRYASVKDPDGNQIDLFANL